MLVLFVVPVRCDTGVTFVGPGVLFKSSSPITSNKAGWNAGPGLNGVVGLCIAIPFCEMALILAFSHDIRCARSCIHSPFQYFSLRLYCGRHWHCVRVC